MGYFYKTNLKKADLNLQIWAVYREKYVMTTRHLTVGQS